ncbi:MAG: hypothetical protein VKJ87_04565 [Synechococcus sp.]|nr:hypothetical protein [Synechococcus sp.]
MSPGRCLRGLLPLLLLALAGCSRPWAQQGDRQVWVEPPRAEIALGGARRQLQIPVRISEPGGTSLHLVVELECDPQRPSSAVISLTRLRRADALLGISQAEPALERSWGGDGHGLPPLWLRRLARQHCSSSLPPAWSTP